MKLIKRGVRQKKRGYFSKRRCDNCKRLNDVELVELTLMIYFCGIPLIPLQKKKILRCTNCEAFLEISEELWEHYKSYLAERFSKEITDEILQVIFELDSKMKFSQTPLSAESSSFLIEKLTKKYGCRQNIEELLSVYCKK